MMNPKEKFIGYSVFTHILSLQHFLNLFCNSLCHQRWNGVSDLSELLCLVSQEFEIIWERLQSCTFSYSRDTVVLVMKMMSMSCVDCRGRLIACKTCPCNMEVS